MERYVIVDKETVWEGRYLRCLKITYRDSMGVLRQWEAVERVNCDGIVAVVPITDEGQAVFIRQFRPAVNNYVIEFPAGLNDRGERLEDAALRELREETGYVAEELVLITRGPLSSGSSGEVLTVFLARGLKFQGIGQRDETEEIEVIKMPVDQLYETLSLFAERGDFIDLKIFGLIEMAMKFLRARL